MKPTEYFYEEIRFAGDVYGLFDAPPRRRLIRFGLVEELSGTFRTQPIIIEYTPRKADDTRKEPALVRAETDEEAHRLAREIGGFV